jgi:molybdopterin-synthase adenylyltransferase
MPLNPLLYDKYSRQMLFQDIGEQGQERLVGSSIALVGCGAIGAAAAALAVRAGIGRLRLIDRDFVEESNLQRQILFDEQDARDALPKAVAAEKKLRAANSAVSVEGIVADLGPGNVHELLGGVDLVLDGTDNFETRLLINDLAVESGTPWIYAAAVAGYGVTMPVLPGRSACLACVLDVTAGVGIDETCDTAGVIGPVVQLIASLEVAAALKLLVGRLTASETRLLSADAWSGRFQSLSPQMNASCRACARRDFVYLQGQAQPHITLCGRDSVQIHERRRMLDLEELSRRLQSTADEVRHNEFLLRFRISPYEITVFSDGRAILKGTQDPILARSLYARYIGC